MHYPAKELTMKDGRTALLRTPTSADAQACLDHLKTTSGETPFLLRCPEEVTLTLEEETAFLENAVASPSTLMLLCFVEDKLAGICQLNRRTKKKNAHRASIGIALVREFWELGLGTAMLRELISAAGSLGLKQVELEVFENNERAQALYRKLGFEIAACTPNAIAMDDGSFVGEYLMILPL